MTANGLRVGVGGCEWMGMCGSGLEWIGVDGSGCE